MPPDVNYELSPEMEEFFKTGELPAALADQQAADQKAAEDAAAEAAAAKAAEEAAKAEVKPVVEPTPEPKEDSNQYLEQLLAQERAQRAEMEKSMKALQDEIRKIQEPKAPDPVEQPLEHLLHKLDAITKQVQGLQEQGTTKAQQDQQLAAQKQFAELVDKNINEFTAKNPDYQDAYKHLRMSRVADLKAAGYTQQEIEGYLNQEEFNVALRAVQTGKNPAEVAYSMAKRMGYQPPKAPEPPASKVEQIKRGLKAADVVPEGKPNGVELNLDSLRGASDADLNKLVESGWEKMFDRPSAKDIF